jgi:hypothetical protein
MGSAAVVLGELVNFVFQAPGGRSIRSSSRFAIVNVFSLAFVASISFSLAR